jgi:Uracil DNA glycosylase superfamily
MGCRRVIDPAPAGRGRSRGEAMRPLAALDKTAVAETDMTPSQFLSALRATRFEHAFNPFADRCAVHDRAKAPETRAKILLALLAAAERRGTRALWLGRDFGWRGGRRSGLAFTDDLHFSQHLACFGLEAARPVLGPPMAERTAAAVWDALRGMEETFFLWNVVPLHPHPPGAPFSNRAHNAAERAAGEAILAELVGLLRPERIIAVGRDAEKAAARVAPGLECVALRHPSFGGEARFGAQVATTSQFRPI